MKTLKTPSNFNKKTLNWNIGIMIIRLGYLIRGGDFKPRGYSLVRWNIGAFILRNGYGVRGNIPMKTWKGNHI